MDLSIVADPPAATASGPDKAWQAECGSSPSSKFGCCRVRRAAIRGLERAGMDSDCILDAGGTSGKTARVIANFKLLKPPCSKDRVSNVAYAFVHSYEQIQLLLSDVFYVFGAGAPRESPKVVVSFLLPKPRLLPWQRTVNSLTEGIGPAAL